MLVTHEPDMAAYARRVVTFRDGRVIADKITETSRMNLRATLRLALQALIRNKVRSLLTMLGIVIGVAAVIVTVAIGTGARVQVQDSINALGSNLIVVQPGSVTTTGARGGLGTASTLTPADGLAIAKFRA